MPVQTPGAVSITAVRLRMDRNIAGEVMVEVLDTDAAREKRRNAGRLTAIEMSSAVTESPAWAAHALQQCDVALDAGDEGRLFGIREPQLMQRADAVRIAVEGIEMRHGRCLLPGREREWRAFAGVESEAERNR